MLEVISVSKYFFLFSLLSLKLIQRGLALISLGKCGSPLIKVTLTKLSISNLRHAFTLNERITPNYAERQVDNFAMFTHFKMTFYPKFLSPTVKVERNKSKIDNIKIIINLLTELKSYLKRYLKRK